MDHLWDAGASTTAIELPAVVPVVADNSCALEPQDAGNGTQQRRSGPGLCSSSCHAQKCNTVCAEANSETAALWQLLVGCSMGAKCQDVAIS